LVNHLVNPKPEFNYEEELVDVIETAETYAFGPSTGSIVNEAHNRNIPSIRINKRWSLVQFGWGKNQKRIWASTSTQSGFIATEIAQDKELTLQMLYDVGIPVPKGGVARRLKEAFRQMKRVGFPLVTKPLDVSHGRGVSLNIQTAEELERGYELAKEYTNSVIIEKYNTGKDFRVLVINGKFVAAANRVPAHVIGDGNRNVEELIEIVNSDPRRGIGHEKPLTKIKIDENTEQLLADQGLKLTDIPEKDLFVQLKSTANLSTGGTSVDYTDLIHYDNIRLAERAVKTIGLDIAGVDIMAPDIITPIKSNGGVIIEVNAGPGFRMHLEPTIGTPRNVAEPVIDMLFPDGSNGRIPLIAVTGTNGKTTASRWISHILKLAGLKVGLATTDGIYIDGELEYKGDTTGPWSAKVVLRDPTVDFAVLETARGGIVREGLGWDYCDVACFLNVSDDHLGSGGIETVDEMAEVKAVILDQVQQDGIGVLNADDQLVMAQRDRIGGSTVLVSLNYKNQHLVKHTKAGGTAITLTPNGVLQLIRNRSQTPILHVKEIPACFGGHALFNIQNAMFAIAATLPFVSVEDIRSGLSTFATNYIGNRGRMNIENLKGARIIIDYGHNPKAFEAQLQIVSGFLEEQNNVGRKAIVLSMPGDRPDQTIKDAAKIIAGQYDKYFIKEDWRLRKRESGEVPNLIRQALEDQGVEKDKIWMSDIHTNELQAVTAMYEWIQLNDIIILQADDIDKVRDHLYTNLAKIQDKTTSITVTGDGEQIFDFSTLSENVEEFDEMED
ncbi:MAG: cyanophycin synthetase, partial [Candidatus Heimdallarchaeota archaeon]|nr:cyanophycin synthetase [Candidatus Heimdallarchaeota archaeon]